MTKERIKQLTEELAGDLPRQISISIDKVLTSGVVNIDDFEDNYLLPKMIMSAVCQQYAREYKPLYGSRSQTKQINEISLLV